ncbi:hypothetical protein TYRP_023000 [Tyrophagus putrescentiae]|nr:hypothetical protein TYRP_023000 [Tyrophagus putrescentiae]
MFNAESEDQHDAYYVYAIFDPVNFKNALDFVRNPIDNPETLSLTDFYNDDNIKLFESPIIYIGSGDYARVTEHVVFITLCTHQKTKKSQRNLDRAIKQIRILKGFKGNRKTVAIASGYKPSLKDHQKRSERSLVINNETLEESRLVFSSVSFDWQIAMKDSFLDNYDINVIIIDWSTSGANSGFYWNAAKSTKQIGILVAKQIKLLCQYQSTVEDKFHLIGHSLGAHFLGFTGKHLDGKICQITGLDPAGLFLKISQEIQSCGTLMPRWLNNANFM